MEFSPKSDRELYEEMIWPAGDYDFEVIEAEEKTSKNGNPMIALKLKVFHPSTDNTRTVRDWLMPSMGFKLKHFCYATGNEVAYDDGTLDAYACEGAAGRVKLIVQESDQYGKQNSVKDYLVPTAEPNPDDLPNDDPPPPPKKKPQGVPTSQANAARAAAVPDDQIPF